MGSPNLCSIRVKANLHQIWMFMKIRRGQYYKSETKHTVQVIYSNQGPFY